jgi:phosphoribosylaminoimidazole carboxylase/phosphoribosylaminoimidazole-succinocarboxamide synthase
MTDPVLLNSGKTKRIWSIPGELLNVRVQSENDVTAGDGAKHDVIGGKAVLSTTTTSNAFKLLGACGIPVAFVRDHSPYEFIAKRCEMLPYEVVARRFIVPKSSSIERDPHLAPGTRYEALVVEFYLKTTGTEFRGINLPFDRGDPLITSIRPGGLTVHYAHAPVEGDGIAIPHTVLGWKADGGEDDRMDPFGAMEKIVRQVFLILEKAWALQGHTLCDLKIEFGRTVEGDLVVADVVDNDSWRVITPSGAHLDKQSYRDGQPLPTVKGKYEEVAERSKRFVDLAERRMNIVLWTASSADDIKPFTKAFQKYGVAPGEQVVRSGSMHKAPREMLAFLEKTVFWNNACDAAIIVHVGRSNGAGPVIAGATHLPVITVPNISLDSTFGPLSTISSLDMPSDMPLSTIMEPGNAVLAALNILAMKNPRAYMLARSVRESYWLGPENSPTYNRKI